MTTVNILTTASTAPGVPYTDDGYPAWRRRAITAATEAARALDAEGMRAVDDGHAAVVAAPDGRVWIVRAHHGHGRTFGREADAALADLSGVEGSVALRDGWVVDVVLTIPERSREGARWEGPAGWPVHGGGRLVPTGRRWPVNSPFEGG